MDTKAPIIQQHELTIRCNNTCSFCYNPERCISAFEPRKEDVKRNLQIAEASIKQGVMAICPTGGEPILVGEHLFEILDIYKKAGCYTSINTNGRLIDETVAEKLAKTKLNTALVSIHGINDVHNDLVRDKNAFKETWQGIVNLRRMGINVTPNFVATSKNIHGLLELGIALSQINIFSMTVTPFLPSWGSSSHEEFILQKDDYQTYFDTVKKIRDLGVKIDSTLPIPPCVLIRLFPNNWEKFIEVHSPRVCMAGKSFGVISPDAYFRACIQAPYFDEFGGNVIENYKQSWKNANSWAEEKLLPSECLECEALDICGGGCRTSCLWENHGTVNGTTMYMGKALSADETIIFKKRISIDSPETHPVYSWRKHTKVRDDGWGIIVFNPLNQSFTVLSPEFKNVEISDNPIVIDSPKLAKTLLAIGVIKKAKVINQKPINLSDQIKVLPANLMLPRLAKYLISKNNEIYCLRADTGERYFF